MEPLSDFRVETIGVGIRGQVLAPFHQGCDIFYGLYVRPTMFLLHINIVVEVRSLSGSTGVNWLSDIESVMGHVTLN